MPASGEESHSHDRRQGVTPGPRHETFMITGGAGAGFASGRAGPRRRYCATILLHCASASRLSEAIGIFAAAVRQACFALPSAVLTFALLVVI